ncbi:MAG TPA: hypothetical protein VNK49_08950 [Anaerolineales bacterium]|nr:hypothetical protein [Anaerolineales bacterium]
MFAIILNLLNVILKALRILAEFLAVVLLGLLAAILLVLPWLLRALAFLGWLGGTFLMWTTVERLYGSFTPDLPLLALTAVPAILSSLLVVWLFYRGRQGHLWGAMTLWGVMGWIIWRGATKLLGWEYGWLVIRILPATFSAVLLLFITIRWGLILRMRRLSFSLSHTGYLNQKKGGDAG